MLHILLLILKMIGIILLCILGILILTVLCLLFVPVRYRIEAVREEGDGAPPVLMRVKVTWLLHLLNVLIRYAGEWNVRIRVTVFPVFRSPKTERSTKRQKRTKNRQKKHERDTTESRRETMESEQSGVKTKNDNAVTEEQKTSAGAGSADEKAVSQKQSILDKLRALFRKILVFFKKMKEAFINIQYTIRHFCDRIKNAWNAIAFRYEVLTSDRFREAWKLCQNELGRVLRHIKPKKLEADIIVGMEDPAATGEVLAVCGMLYPLIGSHVNVTGNFEKKCLEGRFFMKGRISGFVLLWAALKLYRNKNLKNIYGLLKKGDSING